VRSMLIVAMAVLTAGRAPGGETGKRARSIVTACLQTGADHTLSQQVILERAELTATQIFADAGVIMKWRTRPRSCTPGDILIDFSNNTPLNELPGALAYSRPFEGDYVRVFYDRIQRRTKADVLPYLLAHVLAHEITHVLESTSWHSERGVMKSSWNATDYGQMKWRQLTFTETDLKLIRLGLEARKSKPH
jgi:hypothetical protein